MKDRNNRNSTRDHRHPGDIEPSMPIRPQKPRDGYGYGSNSFTPGRWPSGGLTTVWDFSGRSGDYKNSPTSKPDKR